MKLTTTTNVSVDGVMQSLGVPDEDRRGGFERGGWALPLFDNEAATFLLRGLPARRRLVRRQHHRRSRGRRLQAGGRELVLTNALPPSPRCERPPTEEEAR
jgi:hypothetical protein